MSYSFRDRQLIKRIPSTKLLRALRFSSKANSVTMWNTGVSGTETIQTHTTNEVGDRDTHSITTSALLYYGTYAKEAVSLQVFFMVRQPPLGLELRIVEISRSHSDTQRSVGLLWTSDRPAAETSSLTTLNSRRRQTSMPAVPASERPKTTT